MTQHIQIPKTHRKPRSVSCRVSGAPSLAKTMQGSSSRARCKIASRRCCGSQSSVVAMGVGLGPGVDLGWVLDLSCVYGWCVCGVCVCVDKRRRKYLWWVNQSRTTSATDKLCSPRSTTRSPQFDRSPPTSAQPPAPNEAGPRDTLSRSNGRSPRWRALARRLKLPTASLLPEHAPGRDAGVRPFASVCLFVRGPHRRGFDRF